MDIHTKQKVVNLARELREKNGYLHQNVDVVKIAKNSGFKVYRLKNDQKLKGIIIEEPKTNTNVIAFRQDLGEKDNRFIIAHELGQYFLHSSEKNIVKMVFFIMNIMIRINQANKKQTYSPQLCLYLKKNL